MYKLNKLQNQRNFYLRAKTRRQLNTGKNIVQVQQLQKSIVHRLQQEKKIRAKKIRATPPPPSKIKWCVPNKLCSAIILHTRIF